MLLIQDVNSLTQLIKFTIQFPTLSAPHASQQVQSGKKWYVQLGVQIIGALAGVARAVLACVEEIDETDA